VLQEAVHAERGIGNLGSMWLYEMLLMMTTICWA